MTPHNRQFVLPLSKAIDIAFRSIRLRLGRSMLLVSGIALAMAFLISVQTSELVNHSVQRWINSPHTDRTEQARAEQLAETMRQQGVMTSANVRQRWVVGLAMVVAFV